jgi:Domian of unknown function (DUF4952)
LFLDAIYHQNPVVVQVFIAYAAMYLIANDFLISSVQRRASVILKAALCIALACACSWVQAIAARESARAGPPLCADFLAKLGQKPKNLEFIGCKPVRLYGVSALQSDYRVKGVFAGPIEGHLVRTAGMPRLRFICCGWESVPTDVRAQRTYGTYLAGGRSYAVSMASQETLINQRNALHRVDYFAVTVVLYLQEP